MPDFLNLTFLFKKDESKLDPISIPTAIVATKYDVYETYEPEKQKIISKTLRFVAHYFGCCLIVRKITFLKK